ncbi:helix-turn-helix domain-containing protein [Streptomyces venezuelae]|uniref:helix-turn-helix domain-containing protein n=1 Tax=Streptomyces venezuelae TaxID=54571 RepID=UPI0037BC821A
MGRREKPLEPTAGPVPRLAHRLRKLRADAGGPTYRTMAQRVPYSAPTLSAAAAGERLPTLPVLRAYVTACGGDPEEWERHWYETVAEDAEHGTDEGESPYPGLARFGAGDEDRFYGRDDLVASLVDLTARRRVTSRGAVRGMSVTAERAADSVCARARGGLTRQEWRMYLPDFPYRQTC